MEPFLMKLNPRKIWVSLYQMTCSLRVRCFTGFSERKILTLYTSLIRPILEYASPVWSPWMVKDVEILQNTQKGCLKLCPEEIQIESLEERRERMDLLETFKLIRRPRSKVFPRYSDRHIIMTCIGKPRGKHADV